MNGGGELPRRRVAWILVGLVLSIFVAVVNGTTVVTALPTIAGELHGLNRVSWLVTAYLLGQVVSMPLYGKLGDLFGRKRMLQAALTVFLVGTALAGFAWSMNTLIVFRAVQGLGSGGLIVTAQGIIGDVVPPRQRGRYMSLLAPMIGVGTVAGPTLGGFLIDYWSWRWIFFANLPLVLVALLVTTVTIKLPLYRRRPHIDYLGAVLLGGAVTAIVLVTTWAGTAYPWVSGVVLGLIAAAAGLFAGWVAVERRAPEPIIPLRLFSDRVFVVSVALGVAVGMAMFSAVTYLPTYLQIVSGASATRTGLLLLPLMGGMIVASVAAGQLMALTGRYKLFPICGTALAAVGMFLLSTMGAGTPHALAVGYMALLGAGIGLVMPVLTTAVQNSVPHGDLGAATSGVNLFRQTGGAVGAALAGTLFTTRLQQQLLAQLPPELAGQATSRASTITPRAIERMPAALQQGVVAAFANALPSVYLVFVPILAAAFVLAWFMKEKPLGTAIGAESDAASAAGSGVEGTDEAADISSRRDAAPAAAAPGDGLRAPAGGPDRPSSRVSTRAAASRESAASARGRAARDPRRG